MDTTACRSFEFCRSPFQTLPAEDGGSWQTLLDCSGSSTATPACRTSFFQSVRTSLVRKRVPRETLFRYYPPDVSPEHLIVHRLLSMFHPRPFILSRFPPQGTIAVVRARHGPFLDISFRSVDLRSFASLETDSATFTTHGSLWVVLVSTPNFS